MKKFKNFVLCLLLAALPLTSLFSGATASAAAIAGETFSGVSTAANQWISGGTGTGACLTAASSSAANSIPACSGGSLDTAGSGALRLTNNTNNQSGFAIYNTPISAGEGLNVEFDMFQYAGTGADGIVFFLLDGTANPTQPGALGGSLGYSSSNGPPAAAGIVGGYIGVGFDRYGNFSNPAFGNGGTGAASNSITVRGSETTNYKFVTRKSASGPLAVESTQSRASAKRHVRVTVNTNNIMNVAVNYFDGQGLRSEVTNINLNTVNGAGSLPATFKFGFSAGTGGSNNIHEIQGLSVGKLNPNVKFSASKQGIVQQGEDALLYLQAFNDAGAQNTTGTITMTATVPNVFQLQDVYGDGWSCARYGQQISCSRPGDDVNALTPGASAPKIFLPVKVAIDGTGTHTLTGTVSTVDNVDGNYTQTTGYSIIAMGDADGIRDSVEAAAPNNGDGNDDGIDDNEQDAVSSLPNSLTGKYSVLATDGCDANSNVSVSAESNTAGDAKYSYPAGLMDFALTCGTPGATATVTQYYFGNYDPARYVMRKYSAASKTYQTIAGAALSAVTIGGQPALRAVYTITDGGLLDDDGIANGIIIDPAGPALADAVPASATVQTGGALANTGLNIAGATTAAVSLVLCALLVRGHKRQFIE